ncbi:hypothetical protein quinque_003558 [Culex quinquefasciatus]
MNPAELNYQPVATFENYESSRANYKMEKGAPTRQFIAGVVVNLASVALGTCLGWTSPMGPVYSSNDTSVNPLDVIPDTGEKSWIGSLVAMGALIAPFIAGPCAEKFGRKLTLLGSSVFFVVSWVLLLTTSTVGQLLAARLIQGFGVGFVMTVQTMYIGEIASNEYRGALGSLMQLCIVSGILYVYAIGPYVSWAGLQWACLALPVIFAGTFFFMPETPTYYLTKSRRDDAIASLQWLRGKTAEGVQKELEETSASVDEAMKNKAGVMDLFKTKGTTKALIICAGLISFQQLSGINVILFYSQTIFAKTGSTMSPAISTILVGIVQVLASGMCLAHATMGLYFYTDYIKSDSVDSISWLPIFSLIFFVTVYCIGFGPLPWAVLGEMFPANVKSVASSIVASTCWVLGFLVLQFFSTLDEAVGSHWSFWIFGIMCAIAFAFTLTQVMETKGMSLNEIQEALNR